MAIKGSEEVILYRPGEKDRYGDPTGEAVTLGIFQRCVVWPRTTTEVSTEGTVITEGYNVWVPADVAANQAVFDEAAELEATDFVVVRGSEWQIRGVPAFHRSIGGKKLGVQMVVGRVA